MTEEKKNALNLNEEFLKLVVELSAQKKTLQEQQLQQLENKINQGADVNVVAIISESKNQEETCALNIVSESQHQSNKKLLATCLVKHGANYESVNQPHPEFAKALRYGIYEAIKEWVFNDLYFSGKSKQGRVLSQIVAFFIEGSDPPCLKAGLGETWSTFIRNCNKQNVQVAIQKLDSHILESLPEAKPSKIKSTSSSPSSSFWGKHWKKIIPTAGAVILGGGIGVTVETNPADINHLLVQALTEKIPHSSVPISAVAGVLFFVLLGVGMYLRCSKNQQEAQLPSLTTGFH